jgi:trans-L-3-hydroxyproline dehydratase
VLKPDWKPAGDWTVIQTLDAHAAGEPLRIISGGLPPIPGRTVLEKRRWFRDHLDHLRTGLMWEPRGHADMYGAVLVEPETTDGDFGVFFLHNEGYSTMCGHAIIGLATALLDTGLVKKDGDAPVLRIDAPAGRIVATARRARGRVREVAFRNVPSFVAEGDGRVEVPGLGTVRFDIAFGGAFYAFCDADALGLPLDTAHVDVLIDRGRRIKRAVMDSRPVRHPFSEDLSFLYGTIFVGRPGDPAHHSRNVCVFADGEVDRSPTGTGVSARAALHFARGELARGESIVVESIIGTTFRVRVVDETTFGPYPAVIPEVTGTAALTGRSEFWFDPEDPLARGFILR